jgi:hypothetical protein
MPQPHSNQPCFLQNCPYLLPKLAPTMCCRHKDNSRCPLVVGLGGLHRVRYWGRDQISQGLAHICGRSWPNPCPIECKPDTNLDRTFHITPEETIIESSIWNKTSILTFKGLKLVLGYNCMFYVTICTDS